MKYLISTVMASLYFVSPVSAEQNYFKHHVSCTSKVVGGTTRKFTPKFGNWPMKDGSKWRGVAFQWRGQVFLKIRGNDLIYVLNDGTYRIVGAYEKPPPGVRKTSHVVKHPRFRGTATCRWK